jgi:hypothetical protein
MVCDPRALNKGARADTSSDDFVSNVAYEWKILESEDTYTVIQRRNGKVIVIPREQDKSEASEQEENSQSEVVNGR